MGASRPGLTRPWGIISYADEIKFIACSTAGLHVVFSVVEASLLPLGLGFVMRVRLDLDCSGSVVWAVLLVVLDKCSALVFGDSRASTWV